MTDWVYLLETQPYDPALPGTRPINFSSNLPDDASLVGTTTPYHVRLKTPLTEEISVFDSNLPDGSSLSVSSVVINNVDGKFDYLAKLNWDSRLVTVKRGSPNQPYSMFRTVFTGSSLELTLDLNDVTISLRDNSYKLAKPLQPTTYSGTGGPEGVIDIKGGVKPLLYGRCVNMTPVPLDIARLTFQLHDGAIEAVEKIFDRGVPLTAGADYANYTLLIAATIAPGSYATCLAFGYFRLGAKPVGTVTVDARGQYYTSGATLPALLKSVMLGKMGLTTADLHLPSFNQLSVDFPYACQGVYLTDSVEMDEFLQTIVASMNAFWFIDAYGLIRVAQFKFRTPVTTIRMEDVASLLRSSSAAEFYRVRTNYGKNSTVQPGSDFTLPRISLNGRLKDNKIFVATDSAGAGGVYTYTGEFLAYLNTTKVNTIGSVLFTEVTPVSWLNLASDGTFTVSDPGVDVATATLQASLGEFSVQETFTLQKSKQASPKNLVLSQDLDRFYFDNFEVPNPTTQTVTYTAVRTNVTNPLTFAAVDNLGNVIPLTGTGDTRTLAIATLPHTIFSAWILVTVTAPDGTVNTIRTLISHGDDAYSAGILSSIGATDDAVNIFYQPSPPTTALVDDLWFDTDDSNKIYRWNGTAFELVSDTRVPLALTNAAGAQATADGKITTFYTTGATPTATALGDLWYNSTTKVLQRWNGTTWAAPVSNYITSGSQINVADYATRNDDGENLLINPSLDIDSSAWVTTTGVARTKSSTYPPIGAWFDFNTTGGIESATANNNALTPVLAAKTYYVSGFVFLNPGVTGQLVAVLDYFDASGTYISNGIVNLTPARVGDFVPITGLYFVPATALYWKFRVQTNLSGGHCAVANMRLAKSEFSSTRNVDGGNMINDPINYTGGYLANGAIYGVLNATGRPAERKAIQMLTTSANGSWGGPVPCTPGEKLWLQYVIKSDGTGTNTCNASFSYYSASGAALGAVNMSGAPYNTSRTLTQASAAFLTVSCSLVVPSGAAYIQVYVERPVFSGANSFYAGEPILTRSQLGADVTGSNTALDTAYFGGTVTSAVVANLATATTQANLGFAFARDVADNNIFSEAEKQRYVSQVNQWVTDIPVLVASGKSAGAVNAANALNTAWTNFYNYLVANHYSSTNTRDAIVQSTFLSLEAAFSAALNDLASIKIPKNGANLIQDPITYSGGDLLNGAVYGTIDAAGRPLFRKAIQLYTPTAIGQWGDRIPVVPGETLFYAHSVTTDGGSSGESCNMSYQFFGADGTLLGAVNRGNAYGGTSSAYINGAYAYPNVVLVKDSFVVPAGAGYIRLYVERATATGYSFYIGEPYLGRAEGGADVSANSAVINNGSIAPSIPNGGFTYTSTTGSITISWSAFTIYRANGTSFVTNSGSYSISGLAGATTFYFYPYVADTGSAGPLGVQLALTGQGTPSYACFSVAQRTAGATVQAQRGNIGFGTVAAATPSTGSGGGSGGGYNCVDTASFLPHGGVAGDLAEGSRLYLLNATDDGYEEGIVSGVRTAMENCYRLVCRNGVSVVCTGSTPITTRNSIVVSVADCIGVEVPVLDHGTFGWSEIVAVEELGVREVAMVSAGNGTYAAGEHKDRYMFTHNYTYKP